MSRDETTGTPVPAAATPDTPSRPFPALTIEDHSGPDLEALELLADASLHKACCQQQAHPAAASVSNVLATSIAASMMRCADALQRIAFQLERADNDGIAGEELSGADVHRERAS